MRAESRSGDDVTAVTVRVRVSNRPERGVLSVPVRILRVVVGGISTVSGSRRITPSKADHSEYGQAPLPISQSSMPSMWLRRPTREWGRHYASDHPPGPSL